MVQVGPRHDEIMRKVSRCSRHDRHRLAGTTDSFPEIRLDEECDDNMHCDFGEKKKVDEEDDFRKNEVEKEWPRKAQEERRETLVWMW